MKSCTRIVGDPKNPFEITDDPDAIDNPILTFFLDYWRQEKGAGALPLRSSFSPKIVRGHLPWVVVADALPGCTDFRYRVVGTHVARYFLNDGTGKTIHEAFARQGPDFINSTISLYRHACDLRTPFRLKGPSSRSRTIYYPEFDAIYLPYSSDGITPDRVVTGFTFDNKKASQTRPIVGSTAAG